MEKNQVNTPETEGFDSEKLTNSAYWDSCYADRGLTPFDDSGYKHLVLRQIIQTIERLSLDQKKICELGGGDAQMLCYLAKRHLNSQFSILDFSESGCRLAKMRADKEGVSIGICQADVFSPPADQIGQFDIVLSQGVVEHFTDLVRVLEAKSRLLKPGGRVFTSIPNFASPIYASLCKKWSRSVWNDHVPHTLQNFARSHELAKMKIVEKGFLGSVEFGMLSMTMVAPEKKSKLDQFTYLYLTRFSKLIHLVEHQGITIPSSRMFSPFLYVIASKDE